MCETTYVAHHTKPELCRSPNLGQPGRTRRARLVRRRRSQRACARRFSSPPARFPHGPNCFSMLRKAILTSTAPPSHRMNRPESPSTEPNSSTPRPLWTILTRGPFRPAKRLNHAVRNVPARFPARSRHVIASRATSIASRPDSADTTKPMRMATDRQRAKAMLEARATSRAPFRTKPC
jgi:hypothetical protein